MDHHRPHDPDHSRGQFQGASFAPGSPAPAIGSAPPIAPFVAPSAPSVAPPDAVCLQCGYPIPGMTADRHCPECGTPISRSLQGNLLVYSSTSFLRSMHIGLNCVLLAVVLSFAIGLFVAIGIIVALSTGAFNPAAARNTNIELWASLLTLPVSALTLIGWWMFSAPDPALRQGDTGQTPRLVIRVTVIIIAVAAVIDFTVRAMAAKNIAFLGIAMGTGMLSGLAGLVQFFAAMLYVRWLATRIPARDIHERAQNYLWLLPVIYLAGSCIIIGPLVASILFLLLLNNVRLRLKSIREHQARAFPQPG